MARPLFCLHGVMRVWCPHRSSRIRRTDDRPSWMIRRADAARSRLTGAALPVVVAVALSFICVGAVAAPDDAHMRAYAAVGSVMGQNLRLADLRLSDAELEAFLDGMRMAARGQPHTLDAEGVRTMEMLQQRLASLLPAVAESSPVERYLDEAKHRFQLQQSETGLLFRVQNGAGPRPRPEDTVVITYETRSADGRTELPQLSRTSVRVKVSDLMPGLVEALQMMPLAAEAQLVIPPHLSFGSGAWPDGVEENAPLIMRVRLEDIVPATDS